MKLKPGEAFRDMCLQAVLLVLSMSDTVSS